MVRLALHALGKSYGARTLFSDLSLELRSGQRLAVLGQNGTGKSTLLNIIAGQSTPDKGSVRLDPAAAALGFSVQELDRLELQQELLDWVLQGIPSWQDLWEQWEQASETARQGDRQSLADQQSSLELHFGFNPEHRAKKILAGLGFSEQQYVQPLQALSGGWRERAKLARVLLQGAQVLLLDEPTNHLDLEAVRWLENFLVSFPGLVVFVAHDRFFLEKIANCVLHLAPEGPVYKELGFDEYFQWRSRKEESRLKAREKLQREIEHKQSFVDRFRYKASKAALAQSRIKQINALEEKKQELEIPAGGSQLSFSWPEPARSNRLVLEAKNLGFKYDQDKSLWPELDFALYKGQKVALLGANGAGKSSLLKLVAGELKPDKGSLQMGSKVVPAFFHQHVGHVLKTENKVLQEIQRLSAADMKQEELCFALGLFQLGQEYWTRTVSSLSGGEKNRLVLASVFLRRANLLILDEPTNHLDLESRTALIQALQSYSGTLLLVSHDRHLLSQVAHSVWVLSNSGLEQYAEDFEQYMSRQEEQGLEADSVQDMSSRTRRDRDVYKRQKRLQAERRNELYRALQPCKTEYSSLEQRLEECLQQQQDVESALASPETYNNGTRVQELNRSYAQLQQEAEDIMRRMEELEVRIKELQGENSAAQA